MRLMGRTGRGRRAMMAGLGPLLLLSGAAAAREAGRAPVFPSQLELVYLNVVVQDERGRMVTNLGPEDFSVFEDGVVQRVELFGRAHEPGNDELMALDLGMLFDTSESMLKELRLSQEAAARFLESVPRARDLVTVFFDQDIRVSRYDSENQQGLFDRIWAAKGGGNTALYDSVAVYLSRIRDTPGRQVLVLFTDGEDSTSTTTLDDALRLLKASPVTVYAIGFRGGFTPGSTRALTASSVLRAMTGLTGGTLFTPQTSRELPEVYERILNDLQSQYVLGYAPTDARRDGRFRKLKVTLKERGLKVRHRVGYVAEGDQLAVK